MIINDIKTIQRNCHTGYLREKYAGLHFILGAADPEMEAIEELIQAEYDAAVVTYATKDGARVFPSTAYKADAVEVEAGHLAVFVECQPEAGYPDGALVIDNHRPGDAGHGVGPKGYFLASSIGQVYKLVKETSEEFTVQEDADTGPLLVFSHGPYGAPAAVRPDPHLLLTAASDHCPGAAYRGECEGVTPGELMSHRASIASAFQGKDYGEYLKEVLRAMDLIQARAQQYDIPHFEESVPQLPEASLRTGIPVSYEMDDRSGRRKVGLLNADPETVSRWMEVSAPEMGLVDIYGAPERGYAGGFKS